MDTYQYIILIKFRKKKDVIPDFVLKVCKESYKGKRVIKRNEGEVCYDN